MRTDREDSRVFTALSQLNVGLKDGNKVGVVVIAWPAVPAPCSQQDRPGFARNSS